MWGLVEGALAAEVLPAVVDRVTYLVCHLPKTIAQQCHIDAGFPKTPHPTWLWVVLRIKPCVLLLFFLPVCPHT